MRPIDIFLVASFAASATLAHAADADVLRLQQQREQQQMQLQLKMQQQQERALRPPPSAGADYSRSLIERDQLQRQQQLQQQQSRGAIAPDAAGGPDPMRRELDNQRAGQAAAEQSRRFEVERATRP